MAFDDDKEQTIIFALILTHYLFAIKRRLPVLSLSTDRPFRYIGV